MAETTRAVEEALMLLRRAIRESPNDHLEHAFDVLAGDHGDAEKSLEEFDSLLAMLLAEIHEHELDSRDDGWWVCWCGQYVRRVEYEDLFDPDEHR